MKDTKNIINKYSFDRYELERNFDIEMEDETFKKLVSKLKLSKDELIKYTSRIKDASLELKNCANCKNIMECKNSVVGHVYYPEAQEENMEDYHVQDLEPEAVNEGIISADSGVAGVSRTEMDELEMMEKPKVEKPEDKEIISVQEVDLDALFAETSSSLAKEAGEDAAEKAEEEPAVEEVTAEEIIGEPEEVVAEEKVDAAGDVLEERVEGAVETVTEEKEPAETLTDAADEAMAAFEASLSGLSLDFAEETSSDAPETETSAELTEEQETEEDITGSEAAPVIEMEYPEETEETEPEIEDLDATRVIPDVTKQDAWHATPGDTQEFNLEEELKAALSGMDELREQEEAERSASLDPETASEEEIAFEEKTEPMTEENTTEESVVERGQRNRKVTISIRCWKKQRYSRISAR